MIQNPAIQGGGGAETVTIKVTVGSIKVVGYCGATGISEYGPFTKNMPKSSLLHLKDDKPMREINIIGDTAIAINPNASQGISNEYYVVPNGDLEIWSY